MVYSHSMAIYASYQSITVAKVGRQGADINFTQPKSIEHNNQENATLLMFACKNTHINIVEILLMQHTIRIFQKDKMNKNAAHYAIQNKSEEESQKIIQMLFERYPQLVTFFQFQKELGSCQNGNYVSMAIDNLKPNVLKIVIQQQSEGELIKNQGLILHRVMRMHSHHKKFELTFDFFKILMTAGCREDLLNEKQQNYIRYAVIEGIMSEDEINQMMKQLKPESFKKQQTLQTSPQQKLHDSSPGEEEEFWQNSSFSESNSEVFSYGSDAYEPKHPQISEQMYKMALQVQQSHQKTWETLYPFYLKLHHIITQLYGTVQVIGSFASKLWIPNCDIDFLLIIPEQNQDLFDEIVENVYYKVKKLGCHYHIKFSLAYKLPMIKLILSKQFGSLEVELFLSSKKNIATQYVSFIHEVMIYYPEVQIIYWVIRKLLEVKLLHDHKNGGLKAYGLFLLIYSMRSQYQYQYVSQFLQHFAYYYGMAYEYVGEIVEGQVAYKINIIDPLNSQNNMGGKKTDIQSLQELFKKVYYGINLENDGGKIAYLMDLIKEI